MIHTQMAVNSYQLHMWVCGLVVVGCASYAKRFNFEDNFGCIVFLYLIYRISERMGAARRAKILTKRIVMRYDYTFLSASKKSN